MLQGFVAMAATVLAVELVKLREAVNGAGSDAVVVLGPLTAAVLLLAVATSRR